MEISGLVKQSLWDFPDILCSTIFTQGCNLRCPMCHNGHLLAWKKGSLNIDDVLNYLKEAKMLIDGICITGGEPTLHPDLPEFISKLKDIGYKIKLDTNGTNPEMLKRLIAKDLLDYIAMDVKAPLNRRDYSRLTGIELDDVMMNNIRQSIDLIAKSGIGHEFRTTYCPVLLTKSDIVEIASALPKNSKYVLQQFIPEHTLDPELRKEKSPTREEMEDIAVECRKYVDVEIRVYV